jgi:hypothetical protein
MQDVKSQRGSLEPFRNSSLERILGFESAGSLFGQLDKIHSLQRVSRQRGTCVQLPAVTQPEHLGESNDETLLMHSQSSHFYSHTEIAHSARLEMRAHKPFSQPVKATQKSSDPPREPHNLSSHEVLQPRIEFMNGLSPKAKELRRQKNKERAPHKIKFTRHSTENKDPGELRPHKTKKNPFSSTLFPREEEPPVML